MRAPSHLTASFQEKQAAKGPRAVWRALAASQEDRAQKGNSSDYLLAVNWTRAGEFEKARKWLESGYLRKAGWFPFIGVDPAFEPLRTQPFWDGLLERLNLGLSH